MLRNDLLLVIYMGKGVGIWNNNDRFFSLILTNDLRYFTTTVMIVGFSTLHFVPTYVCVLNGFKKGVT